MPSNWNRAVGSQIFSGVNHAYYGHAFTAAGAMLQQYVSRDQAQINKIDRTIQQMNEALERYAIDFNNRMKNIMGSGSFIQDPLKEQLYRNYKRNEKVTRQRMAALQKKRDKLASKSYKCKLTEELNRQY